MILSGARGVLHKVDSDHRIITLGRRSGMEDYECADSAEPGRWVNLVGKVVDVQLRDFLVIDVSENPDPTRPPAKGEK
jgi:hypothetical protein